MPAWRVVTYSQVVRHGAQAPEQQPVLRLSHTPKVLRTYRSQAVAKDKIIWEWFFFVQSIKVFLATRKWNE
jgi:hypothetical protein